MPRWLTFIAPVALSLSLERPLVQAWVCGSRRRRLCGLNVTQ
jgi:hypothetical protein